MKKLLLTLILSIPLLAAAQVYERHFKITSNDEKVGYLIARQKVQGDMTHYEIISQVDARLLVRINLDTEIHASYDDGVLQFSSATTYLNGNTHTNSKIEKQKDTYLVEKDGHSIKIFEPEISFSSAKLYFHEPADQTNSLSESEGIIKQIEKSGEKKYTLTTKGNTKDKSIYTYSSDQGLYQIEVERSHLPDLKIKRVRNVNEEEE